MIKLLLADDQALVRGAMAALLDMEPDLKVVAEVGRGDQSVSAIRRSLRRSAVRVAGDRQSVGWLLYFRAALAARWPERV